MARLAARPGMASRYAEVRCGKFHPTFEEPPMALVIDYGGLK